MKFIPFPKIPRLNREVIVTEKIDGTNASILIQRADNVPLPAPDQVFSSLDAWTDEQNVRWLMLAGSRTRWLWPGADNFGFAAWVMENHTELRKLGEGHHFGEWWGKGIQRGYSLEDRRFSLFNTSRWGDPAVRPACCNVVPILAERFTDMNMAAANALDLLREHGSLAAPGFMRPEGVVVFHTASQIMFKATLEKDDEWKGKAA